MLRIIASEARCLSPILLVHSYFTSSYQFLFPILSLIVQSTIGPMRVRLSSATAGEHCLRNVRPPHSRLSDGRSDCSSQCADVTLTGRPLSQQQVVAHTANHHQSKTSGLVMPLCSSRAAISIHNALLLPSKKPSIDCSPGIVSQECNLPLGMWLLAACARAPVADCPTTPDLLSL
jgi:hypothetical protein